jgi:hypothetical protein
MNTNEIIIFDTRVEMLKSLVQPNSCIAEIGVFAGDFAKEILTTVKPSKLVLIDAWGGDIIVSGDVDGNNVRFINANILYGMVLGRFMADMDVISIHKEYSDYISTFPDNYFDTIYIDADHEYPGVFNDLKRAFPKVKNGGFIMGHDIEMNHDKTAANYTFGVKRSVEEFCETYNQKVYAKGMDGCVSFAVKVEK